MWLFTLHVTKSTLEWPGKQGFNMGLKFTNSSIAVSTTNMPGTFSNLRKKENVKYFLSSNYIQTMNA